MQAGRAELETPRRRGARRLARGAPGPGTLGTLAIAAAVFALALNTGSFSITARGVAGVVVWWGLALAVASGLLPVRPVARAVLVAGGFLAGLALLSGLSIAWTPGAETAFLEANRILLYLGVFLLVALFATGSSPARWVDGIGIGIVAIAIVALVARLFPHMIDAATDSSPFEGDPRATWPLGYWNALGVLVALGIPPMLRAAVLARYAAARAAAVATLPLLAATIYLTSSRGGVGTAVVATVAYVALTRERGRTLVATAIGAAAGAGAIAVLAARSALLDEPFGDPAAIGQGHSAAILIGAICLGAGAAYLVATRLPIRVPAPSRRVGIALGVVALLGAGAAAAASDPGQRLDDFKTPPATTSNVREHLGSGSGSGRWQFWSAAVDEFEAHPVAGGGAGSFPAWWLEHGSLRYFTGNAHSLYLQTLGELGLVGLALLLAMLGTVAFAAVRRLRGPPAGRAETAAVAALAIGFLAAAAFDWMWQIPAVALVGIAALALLAGTDRREAAPGPRPRWPWRVGVVVLGAAAVVAQAIPLVTRSEIERSQERAARYDFPGAFASANDARRIQPWAASPYMQLALLHEATGDPWAAEESLRDAIDRDDSDWRLWLLAARVAHRQGDAAGTAANLRRATQLNPRSPLIASFRRALDRGRR